METKYASEISATLSQQCGFYSGKFVSFDAMTETLDKAQAALGDQGSQLFLRHLATDLKLKPSFTTDGFSIVSVDGPNMECPPLDFSFRSDWPSPSRSVGETFYPLIKRTELDKYFAHSIRWFKHPLRPGMMLPLRLETFFLGVDHPVSRMYVDVPVVFKGRKYLSYIRVSLTVFEIILGSQIGNRGRWVSLSKTSSSETHIADCLAPSEEDYLAMWNLFPEYERKAATNKHYVDNKSPVRYAVRMVADHLVKL